MIAHKKFELVLASGSQTRAKMLSDAGLEIESISPRVDEDSIKSAMIAEGATPRDIADFLAEQKSQKVSRKVPEAMVLGCDQILDFDGNVLSKSTTPDDARAQLKSLSGKTHKLFSAAVVCQGGKPLWRHIGTVTLTMHPLSDAFIDKYIERNWPDVSDSVGSYKLEQEGVRLFSQVRGDFFDVLGLPLIPFLNWLVVRGDLEI